MKAWEKSLISFGVFVLFLLIMAIFNDQIHIDRLLVVAGMVTILIRLGLD